MSELDRVVAGISCREVLTRLSEYLDGELPPPVVGRVEEHLKGCDRCERFGGRFTGVVRALRRELADPEPVPPEVAERLRRRLETETAD